ncbi:YcxB family protein [Hyphococcus sp.]|uniref:YcxB family protein n=1 Tax=Hyphococcus sp. TaxID=2038636 RepID=UPI002085F54E|nr:MAG: hypothetical protein DHS20C04_09540 [Marinicaulis sp.]
MQVDVTITRMDLVRVNLYLWPRIKWTWFQVVGLFVVCVTTTILTLDNFSIDDLGLIIAISAPIAVVFSMFVFALCLTINVAAASPRTGLGAHHYELKEEGLRESTELNEEISKWKTFDRVWRSKDYILLKKHWAAMHMFPARCFDSRKRYDAFYDAIEARVKAASSTSA